MAQYAMRFQAVSEGEARCSVAENDLAFSTAVVFGADPAGSVDLVAPVPQALFGSAFCDKELVRVELTLFEDGPVGNPVRLTTWSRSNYWFLEVAAGAQDMFSNGAPTLRAEHALSATGPYANTPTIWLGADALAEFVDSPTACVAYIVLRPRYQTYGPLAESYTAIPTAGNAWMVSWLQGTAWLDSLVYDPANPVTFLRDLERRFAQSAGQVTVGSGASAVTVNQCAFAATDRRRMAWIAPGDVGTGPGQIPPDMASNTADRMAYHPAAFWTGGRGTLQRSIGLVAPRSAAIDASFGAPVFCVVDGEVTCSRWLFVVDNTPITGIVLHPLGSTLRRPRDIWNQVIVPAINHSGIGGGLVLYRDSPTGLGPVFGRELFPQTVLGDLRRMTYAHFLEPLGTTYADSYSVLFQV